MKKGASLDDPVIPTASSWAWSRPDKPKTARSATAAPTYFLARRTTGIIGSIIDRTLARAGADFTLAQGAQARAVKLSQPCYRSVAVLGDHGLCETAQ